MKTRAEFELFLRMLTGGKLPRVGDVLVFTEKGWTFLSREEWDELIAELTNGG